MASYLPETKGLLPLWLLLVAVTSMGNSIQAYTTLSYTRRLYAGPPPTSTSSTTKTTKTTTTVSETTSGPASSRPTVTDSATTEAHTSPVTPLSARTFGTWTFLVAVVRMYAAYHLEEKPWYQLATWTYVVACAHFMSECFVYKTARAKSPWLIPTSIAVGSLVWMLVQYSSYVKK